MSSSLNQSRDWEPVEENSSVVCMMAAGEGRSQEHVLHGCTFGHVDEEQEKWRLEVVRRGRPAGWRRGSEYS